MTEKDTALELINELGTKKLALICANKILDEGFRLKYKKFPYDYNEATILEIEFWRRVINEIRKL